MASGFDATGMRVVMHLDPIAMRSRDALGQFQEMNQQLTPMMEELAKSLQEAIATELRARIRRTGRVQLRRWGRDSRTLPGMIVDPRNREVTRDRFQVMIPKFLDSGPTRYYWRELETGTAVHVGQEFPGYFLDRSLRRIRPGAGSTDPILVNLTRHLSGEQVESKRPVRLQRADARARTQRASVAATRAAGRAGGSGGAGAGRGRSVRTPIPTMSTELKARTGGGGEGRTAGGGREGGGGGQGRAKLPAGVWPVRISHANPPYWYIEEGYTNWRGARQQTKIEKKYMDRPRFKELGIQVVWR
jgi:hypothetical protein